MRENEISVLILDKVKLSMWLTTDAFDSQLISLIQAALIDLKIAGVNGEEVTLEDPQVLLAVTTYCKLHFGTPDESYDRLKKAYDEMKAQMSMASGYTNWGVL